MNKDSFWSAIIWITLTIILLVLVTINANGCALFRGFVCGTPNSTEIVPQTPSEKGQIQVVKSATIVVAIALAGIGISIAATMWMPKFGFPALVGCVGSLAASLVVIKYYSLIAILGVVSSLIGALCICLYIVVVKTKAFKELVYGIQMYRKNKTIKTGTGEYRSGGLDSILNGVESNTTKKLVAETKIKMKLNKEIN